MKSLHIKLLAGAAVLSLASTSCSKLLDEEPRSIYEPGFFSTERGVNGGLTSMYAHLRYIYGNAYYYNATQTGTDEATWGRDADENFLAMDLSGRAALNANNSRADVLWVNAFPNINTASGIIKNATAVGISPALVAEARFFRAFDYFMLVQTFGGVPLDLGAGELQFNTNPVRTSTRNTVPEVYTKAVFPDLLQAINDLPAAPRVIGGATKTAARLYLAKAYLTYAWWLENPNNIPTYPAAPRTDPAGRTAQYYYQQAYDVATAAIADPGPFKLQATYYDVNVATNDRNPEMLLFADHTESSELYNGGSLTFGSGGSPDNFAGWMMTWNYTNLRSAANPDGSGPISSVQREAEQHLGRPWNRMAPTVDVLENTFADKTNDSRYDGTFTTVYRGNWPKANVPNAVLYNANNLPVTPGSAILTFLDSEPATAITYPSSTGANNVGAGVLPGRADYVISPRGISRIVYPGLWKLGPYRTDNGTGLGQPNAGSTRPFNIAKFSELYFVAAEAAVKGATTKPNQSARELINVIRARAGKWRFDNNGNVAKVQDNSAAMMAATPATITINYILAERSREYYAEGYRWFDLVRTQKWNELATTYRIAGTAYGDHTPATVTRSIQPFHYLRPIPQVQLDRMDVSPDVKATYQNPSYN
ncbi:RagB/SusD family nutrient uptake outer membrane protein [Hymenobacter properus]|uniref:RagB/SusD family nutrient uptake outer membrane protein n=1 Tax=Hymenobacter properus TaxID=2791026 RepID=A0A931FH76_9BACT|nr:RagB/SusD family nutrient uptake outer membrane protein [Hymenobacter properus]MBF9140757.1 RagB/SusD family nutrient uptake outer membrane protein [Hymenobacter properus]MBR7719566.1 RagB/SusD family nutrient uptake outer membrane protein [Microvirga sp. SRT04]